MLQSVVVLDDFSIQVNDVWGRSFLANISAGERQMVSICLVAALARMAGSVSALEMPFFMDTPFGRLSSGNRTRLLRHIPEIATQWVLLATDTEFTRDEAMELSRGGRWGRCYRLVGAGPGETRIEETVVKNVPMLLSRAPEAPAP
jgi:DNA sulfur modification protein DndD